jgi:hypothetical protein
LAEKDKEQGIEDQLYIMPEGVNEEEVLRLSMKVFELRGTPSVQRCPATSHMVEGVDEEEASRLTMEASHVRPAPQCQG